MSLVDVEHLRAKTDKVLRVPASSLPKGFKIAALALRWLAQIAYELASMNQKLASIDDTLEAQYRSDHPD